jgi:hypothetical protein
MYRDLRENFWWSNMKGEIAECVRLWYMSEDQG